MEDLNHLSPDLFSKNTVLAFLAKKMCGKTRPGVLDVGGINGRLHEFLDEYSKYVILDKKPQPEAAQAEDKTTDGKPIKPVFRQADARKIPFSDRNFDIVFASDILEHFDAGDRSRVINELIRVSNKCILIGAPLNSNLTVTAEELIRGQYYANTNVEHPFLAEHEAMGLPDEEQIDNILKEAGVNFIKVREGNLMNWLLQQLYTGTYSGGMESFEKYGFYTFFNEHLRELGTLRPPTYRTIYCIARDGEIQADEIYKELQTNFTWSSEAFMQLMRIAFDDLRFLINGKNEAVTTLEKDLSEQEEKAGNMGNELDATLAKAKKSTQVYRDAILELRNILQEKEMTVESLTSQAYEKEESIKKLDFELQKKEKREEKIFRHIDHLGDMLKKKKQELADKNRELLRTKYDLSNNKKALKSLINSRAWKAVMIYSKVKMALIIKPFRLVKKGMRIWRLQGAKVFFRIFFEKVFGRNSFSKRAEGYKKYIEQKRLLPGRVEFLKKQIADFEYKPLISIVMPVYNVDEKWLVKAIESVQMQIYDIWELCICDDASIYPNIRRILEDFAEKDERIKVKFRTNNGGIVKASNDALGLASGDYVGLLDNDDELAQEALYEVVKVLQEKRYDLIYSDEDKMEMDGTRTEPFFKPDWSPDLLLSCNYICHFGVYRREILSAINGFREGFDGSQDYDLILRFTEKTQLIRHIPLILYHWRKISGSAAESEEAKPYAYESAKRALQDRLKRQKIEADVIDGLWKGSYRIKRRIRGNPLVSIVIPFKDQCAVLEKCLNSIFTKTTHKNYEIILVNNRSELYGTWQYLEKLSTNPKIRQLNFDESFNYSAINNLAVKKAAGEFVILLNNDTEIISPDWIETMLEQAQREEVGAVGIKLLYPNNTIQHAGVFLGLGGIAGHASNRQIASENGYCGMVNVIRNFSSVTAACMMVRKDVYTDCGGFNEQQLAVAFNDVDFCLRLREKGYLIVYSPFAVLYHHESISRGYKVNMREVKYVQKRHGSLLKKGDPYYNRNLTIERADYSLRCMDKVKNFQSMLSEDSLSSYR